jgi:hypothetical protein
MSEPQYEDYINSIRAEAWRRVKRNPLLDFDDLISAASIGFEKAKQSWDPARNPNFNNHLYWKIGHCMWEVEQKCHPYLPLDESESIQIADDKSSPFEETKFRAGLASLSKEALEVVYLVLESPGELVDWTIRWIRPSQSSIRTFLHSLGWKRKKIDQVFGEIKTMLQEL